MKTKKMKTRRSSSIKRVRKSTTKRISQSVVLHNADCLEFLKTLPENSIDSGVIDPPYHLSTVKRFGKKGSAEPKDRDGLFKRATKGFMGKTWDGGDIAFRVETWREILRVLKPGAHLLAFGHPRTCHRMTCAIEDAGFEIRDSLHWVYGQGFPKSHNIGKAIDKHRGHKGKVKARRKVDAGICGGHMHSGRKSSVKLQEIRELSRAAKKWEGWGTALKPAHEPIVMARKPLSERTIAKNVLKWGTGGINIDACRIPLIRGEDIDDERRDGKKLFNGEWGFRRVGYKSHGNGRYPSNLIISQKVAADLDDKARYFYCPKVSTKERNEGCEHLKAKQQNSDGKQRTYNDRCAVCGKKFTGSEKTRCQCPPGVKKTDKTVFKNRNNHPTVKPVALMEYLVTLITPKSGVALDCMMGSGSTGIACVNLGFGFLGIEKQEDYFEIAVARIQNAQRKVKKQKAA